MLMNKNELRRRVEKQTIRPLTDDEFEDYIPDPDTGVFDIKDFRDVIGRLRKDGLIRKRFLRDTINVGTHIPLPFTKGKGSDTSKMRAAMGLTQQLTIEQLDGALRKFETGERSPIVLYYPVKIKRDAVAWIWLIKYVVIPESNQKLVLIKRIFDSIAEKYHIHQAQVLAFYVCNIPVTYNNITVIIDLSEPDQINIRLLHSGIATRRLWQAYRKAREFQLQENIVRPTQRNYNKQRDKTIALIWFVEANKQISWQEKFIKWNSEYRRVGWEYKTADSMKVVYSRIWKLHEKRQKELKMMIKEDLADTTFSISDLMPDVFREFMGR